MLKALSTALQGQRESFDDELQRVKSELTAAAQADLKAAQAVEAQFLERELPAMLLEERKGLSLQVSVFRPFHESSCVFLGKAASHLNWAEVW